MSFPGLKTSRPFLPSGRRWECVGPEQRVDGSDISKLERLISQFQSITLSAWLAPEPASGVSIKTHTVEPMAPGRLGQPGCCLAPQYPSPRVQPPHDPTANAKFHLLPPRNLGGIVPSPDRHPDSLGGADNRTWHAHGDHRQGPRKRGIAWKQMTGLLSSICQVPAFGLEEPSCGGPA